ncbi:MAG: hypothetical protein AAFU60_06195, partial [Bacteroidota bacterium]
MELYRNKIVARSFWIFLLTALLVFMAPRIGVDLYFIFCSIASVYIGFLLWGKTRWIPTPKMVLDHLEGRLIVKDDPFEIITDFGERITSPTFKGKVVLKYEGYFWEVVIFLGQANYYFGAKNQIIFYDENQEEKIFYIFLKDRSGKADFEKLARLLDAEGFTV